MDQKTAQRLFFYNPETGDLVWKLRPRTDFAYEPTWRAWNSNHPGKPCGFSGGQGYLKVAIRGRAYSVHRLIILIMLGYLPEAVDHINGDRSDNRWVNLRPSDFAQNMLNVKRRVDNASGHVGVHWSPRHKAWRARIAFQRRDYSLGYFKSIEDAVSARKAAEREFGFHENHGRAA